MELLKERIRKDGVIKEGNVLKVDNFLNHQMDIELFNEIGKEFKRRFADVKVDRILTIEASGIGIAAIAAQYFNVPVVFAKKSQSINLDGTMLSAPIESFTHKRRYEVIVASRFLNPGDNVLIIDDFLANGCAALGLCQIVEAAHANVAGIGIVIEKGFQCGGKMLRKGPARRVARHRGRHGRGNADHPVPRISKRKGPEKPAGFSRFCHAPHFVHGKRYFANRITKKRAENCIFRIGMV